MRIRVREIVEVECGGILCGVRDGRWLAGLVARGRDKAGTALLRWLWDAIPLGLAGCD